MAAAGAGKYAPCAVDPAFKATVTKLPGTVQAEDFIEGDEAKAYYVDGSDNLVPDNCLRASGVTIDRALPRAQDPQGLQYAVETAQPWQWMRYEVEATATGDYYVSYRLAAVDGEAVDYAVTISMLIDEKLPQNYPALCTDAPADEKVGVWQGELPMNRWTTVGPGMKAPVPLKAGKHTVTLCIDAGQFKIDSFRFAAPQLVTPTPTTAPAATKPPPAATVAPAVKPTEPAVAETPEPTPAPTSLTPAPTPAATPLIEKGATDGGAVAPAADSSGSSQGGGGGGGGDKASVPVIVGASLGAFAVLLLAIYFIRRWRRYRYAKTVEAPDTFQPPSTKFVAPAVTVRTSYGGGGGGSGNSGASSDFMNTPDSDSPAKSPGVLAFGSLVEVPLATYRAGGSQGDGAPGRGTLSRGKSLGRSDEPLADFIRASRQSLPTVIEVANESSAGTPASRASSGSAVLTPGTGLVRALSTGSGLSLGSGGGAAPVSSVPLGGMGMGMGIAGGPSSSSPKLARTRSHSSVLSSNAGADADGGAAALMRAHSQRLPRPPPGGSGGSAQPKPSHRRQLSSAGPPLQQRSRSFGSAPLGSSSSSSSAQFNSAPRQHSSSGSIAYHRSLSPPEQSLSPPEVSPEEVFVQPPKRAVGRMLPPRDLSRRPAAAAPSDGSALRSHEDAIMLLLSGGLDSTSSGGGGSSSSAPPPRPRHSRRTSDGNLGATLLSAAAQSGPPASRSAKDFTTSSNLKSGAEAGRTPKTPKTPEDPSSEWLRNITGAVPTGGSRGGSFTRKR